MTRPSRARAFANHAPTTNRPGAGYIPAPKLEEWAKQALPNAVRLLLWQPHAKAVQMVAALPDNVLRSQMLTEYERQAGREAADRVRRDCWALMQGMGVPG
jgi:hypothetical protein